MISFEKAGVHFGRGSRIERQLREGSNHRPGRIPRISRLMALAVHYDEQERLLFLKPVLRGCRSCVS
jgi:hypothetical protein